MLMSYIPEQNIEVFYYKTEQPFDGAITILCKGATLQWGVRIPVIKE